MWVKSYSITVHGIKPETIWKIWSDISLRPKWDIDTEWAEIHEPFVKGAKFYFKPIGGPKLKMHITECIPNQVFTDCFKIPFARMYGIHRIEPESEGLKLITTIKVEGLLGWVLKKVVAQKVAEEIPAQTEMLIKLAKEISP